MSPQDTLPKWLEFRTVEGADLDTQLLMLAFLENPDLPMTRDRLNMRVPVVSFVNIAPIMHSLMRSGWVSIEKAPMAAEPEEYPTELYSLTGPGTATAIRMLTPMKDYVFGNIANLLGFDVETILPDPVPDNGALSAIREAAKSFMPEI